MKSIAHTRAWKHQRRTLKTVAKFEMRSRVMFEWCERRNRRRSIEHPAQPFQNIICRTPELAAIVTGYLPVDVSHE